MRIYLAGVYAGGRGAITTESANLAVTKDYQYPWLLESYHYIGSGRIPSVIRQKGDSIFLDSGAFSMFTQGIKIDLKAYAQFIKDNSDIIHVSSNVDEIGRGKEQESWNNQKTLEDLGVDVKPVHHARDNDKWLVKYLEAGYDYIFLGGMVPEQTPYLTLWLDRIWDTYLTDSQGRPLVKVHGFGLTTESLMFRYPWYSVDSTAWVMTGRFGGCFMDMPREDGTVWLSKMQFSNESAQIRKFDAHYSTLPEAQQTAIRRYVESLGYKISDLQQMYGWRDKWNMEYFKRAMGRKVDRFKRRQDVLF